MDGVSIAQSTKHRRTPKVLDHIEIHPSMGTGTHRVEAHHTSYEHPPESKEFGAEDHKGFYAHIAKHTGRPVPHESLEEQGESEPEPYE